jgi:precorrin-2 dehydrogenase/sirohydrochlorin ferrochelatase
MVMGNFYPVFLNLTGKLCVVVGGGAVAARKVAALLESGAKVRVVSPELVPELREMVREGRLEYLAKAYGSEDLAGALLVIAAVSPPAVNRRVASDCAAEGILLNVADAPDLGNFIVPALFRRGPLAVAVSTGGAAPALARRLCKELAETYDQSYGEWLEELAAARTRVLREVADPARRKAVLTALTDDKLLELLRREGRKALVNRMAEILGGN